MKSVDFVLRPAGYRSVQLPNNTVGRVYYFAIFTIDEDGNYTQLVDEVEDTKIPVVFASQPVITGVSGPKLLVPEEKKLIIQ